MRFRLDPGELDKAALDSHRDYRSARPGTRRRSTEPDLTRRHRFECRFAEVLAATPEELEAIIEAREAEDARADALMSEEERLGLRSVGAQP